MRRRTRPRQKRGCMCKESRFWKQSDRDWKLSRLAEKEMRDAKAGLVDR